MLFIKLKVSKFIQEVILPEELVEVADGIIHPCLKNFQVKMILSLFWE